MVTEPSEYLQHLTNLLYLDKVLTMINSNPEIWNSPSTIQFAKLLANIGDDITMRDILRDVMTESEIIEISSRLEAARLMAMGANYSKIIDATKLSSRTIARISDWVHNGTGGYKIAIETINHHGISTHLGEA
jgi:uncharacterized protein YerC